MFFANPACRVRGRDLRGFVVPKRWTCASLNQPKQPDLSGQKSMQELKARKLSQENESARVRKVMLPE